MRAGSPSFSEAIRDETSEISEYLRELLIILTFYGHSMDISCKCYDTEFTGPPDPVSGDEKNRRIRVAAQVSIIFTLVLYTNDFDLNVLSI